MFVGGRLCPRGSPPSVVSGRTAPRLPSKPALTIRFGSTENRDRSPLLPLPIRGEDSSFQMVYAERRRRKNASRAASRQASIAPSPKPPQRGATTERSSRWCLGLGAAPVVLPCRAASQAGSPSDRGAQGSSDFGGPRAGQGGHELGWHVHHCLLRLC